MVSHHREKKVQEWCDCCGGKGVHRVGQTNNGTDTARAKTWR
jgi:hypothetical protein